MRNCIRHLLGRLSSRRGKDAHVVSRELVPALGGAGFYIPRDLPWRVSKALLRGSFRSPNSGSHRLSLGQFPYIVETGCHIPFAHPLVGLAVERWISGKAFLVTSWSILIFRWGEVDLEDRFRDQLSGHLCRLVLQIGRRFWSAVPC
jgi:hypothetical protein